MTSSSDFQLLGVGKTTRNQQPKGNEKSSQSPILQNSSETEKSKTEKLPKKESPKSLTKE